MKTILILAIATLSFLSCKSVKKSEYEKEFVGVYYLASYTLIDSSVLTNKPELILKADNQFIIEYVDTVIKGEWGLYDNGDFITLGFEEKGDNFVKFNPYGVEIGGSAMHYFANYREILFQKED